MNLKVRNRKRCRLVCEMVAFVATLAVAVTPAPPPVPAVRVQPAAVQTPFSTEDLPEDAPVEPVAIPVTGAIVTGSSGTMGGIVNGETFGSPTVRLA
jgi:hypothetical protein